MLSKVVALFLGLLVAVLGFFVLMMWIDARDARDGASAPRRHLTRITTRHCP